MRQSLRLSVVLPLLLCSVEGFLWYWELHSPRTVPGYLGNVSPAVPIQIGLDFPATVAEMLVVKIYETVSGKLAAVLLIRVLDLLFVAICWYLIGHWLDGRAARREIKKLAGERIYKRLVPLSLITLGIFTFAVSLHADSACFFDTVQIALLQTWAAFLIGVPFLGFMGPAAQNSVSARFTCRHMSNFRGFMIALGLFATLLAFWVLISPQRVK